MFRTEHVARAASLTCALALWACRDTLAEDMPAHASPSEKADDSAHAAQASRVVTVPARRAPLPSCLGMPLPMELSGQLPYARITVGTGANARTGAFLVDFGSTASALDDNAFAPSPPVPSWCTTPEAGSSRTSCEFSDFSFFGSWGRVSLYRDNFSTVRGAIVQAGLLGTDFLSVHPFTLDYSGLQVLASKAPTFCSDTTLEGAGFVPLSTRGFYAKHLSALRPLADVFEESDGGTTGYAVPNVPTINLRVAGIDAFAQLDTGFDDVLVAHAINVNEPLLNAILAINPSAIVRDETLDLSLTTCIVGVRENVEGYRLAPGTEAAFLSEGGGVARSESRAVLFVKRTPPRARVCGGIGTWRVPAAQIAASYFINAGVVVFDPIRGRVWVPRD